MHTVNIFSKDFFNILCHNFGTVVGTAYQYNGKEIDRERERERERVYRSLCTDFHFLIISC